MSTDVGGTDVDDFQSMVHILLYADVLDIEGLVSSPCGGLGRKERILEIIGHYAHDYANLRTYSGDYPTPDALRAMSYQGETETAPYSGVRRTTSGSEWIVKCARRDDPRPLHVLIWGGLVPRNSSWGALVLTNSRCGLVLTNSSGLVLFENSSWVR